MTTPSISTHRFEPFKITTHTYKRFDGHDFLVDIFVPKKLLEDDSRSKLQRPVAVRFHGGWLIGGQREYTEWTTQWLLDLVVKHDAVYVTPDYRLLPEASGVEEILDDIDDFWKWVSESLPSIVLGTYGVDIDLDRVIVTGDSAGGYLALQSGLSLSASTAKPRIRSVIAAFPMLDLRGPAFTKDYSRQIFDIPQIPNSYIDEQLAKLRAPGSAKIVTNVVFEERQQLCIALVQRGRFLELFGEDKDSSPGKRRIHPEDRVMDGSKLPTTLIYHGADDSAVPVEGSEKFVKLVRDLDAVTAGSTFEFVKIPGGEHGVGNDLSIGSEAWVDDLEIFVDKFW